MTVIGLFDQMLVHRIPFAFVRFNDGEMTGVRVDGSRVARGDQIVSKALQEALIEALKYRAPGYFIGAPCGVCFPNHRELFDTFVGTDEPCRCHAVEFINRNYEFTKSRLIPWFEGRDIVWVSGEGQVLSSLEKAYFGGPVVEHHSFPRRDTWAYVDEVRDILDEQSRNLLYIFSCGPTSRVVVREFWERNPWNTYLDIGSLFDNCTRHVVHAFHRNKLQSCKECN